MQSSGTHIHTRTHTHTHTNTHTHAHTHTNTHAHTHAHTHTHTHTNTHAHTHAGIVNNPLIITLPVCLNINQRQMFQLWCVRLQPSEKTHPIL